MAIQPQARVPSSSSQTLRFTGMVVKDTAALAVYPKANGTLPSDAATTETWGARFLLADATDPTDISTTLPAHVYDDTTPAAASPHAPTTGAVSKLLTATDLIIGAPGAIATNRAWCNNVDIEIKSIQLGALTTGAQILPDRAYIVLDTLTSGLGLNTGLPVLVLPINTVFTSTGPNVAIDITVTIVHSASR